MFFRNHIIRFLKVIFNSSLCETFKKSTCENVLIAAHLEKFNGEFRFLLESDKADDLARMFKMCQKVENGLNPFRNKFEEFIFQRGSDAISNIAHSQPVEPKLYVNTILEVYETFSRINQQAFNGEFKEALDKASARFINR